MRICGTLVPAECQIKEYRKLSNEVEEKSFKINERVKEIIVLIFSFCKKKFNLTIADDDENWWFLNVGTNIRIELHDSLEGDIEYGLVTTSPKMQIYMYSGRYNYGHSFPQQFLVMKDDEIIEYIESEIKESGRKILESR